MGLITAKSPAGGPDRLLSVYDSDTKSPGGGDGTVAHQRLPVHFTLIAGAVSASRSR
ncbi:hypothetical protein RKD18_008016 [Streptomyces phaeoluteigriseus]